MSTAAATGSNSWFMSGLCGVDVVKEMDKCWKEVYYVSIENSSVKRKLPV